MAERGTRSKKEAAKPAPVCPVSVCPVGMFMTFAGDARPEVVEHLLNAGREMILAATAFLNARGEAVQKGPRLEKIDVE